MTISEKKLKIPKRKGGDLISILYENSMENTKKPPLVIFCHGFTGNKYEWGRFPKAAKKMNEKGYNAIIFDFSGSGENKREAVLLSKQVRDLEDVYDWAKEQHYTDFAIIGLSFGGLTALIANLPVHAVIFWAPAFYLKQITDDSLYSHFPFKLPSASPPEIFIEEDFIHELKQINVDKHLQKLKIPSLIVHGELDRTVKPELSKKAQGQMSSKVNNKLHFVKNADHMFNDEQLEEFIAESINWLQKYL
ncbi:MAG: alpha/beta hydrolase [Candidatus Heimdallarchaeota archaeon]|nr:MAG: alpha/beta hydrolase [Candidatus Heimdallarchaeota archaeon]